MALQDSMEACESLIVNVRISKDLPNAKRLAVSLRGRCTQINLQIYKEIKIHIIIIYILGESGAAGVNHFYVEIFRPYHRDTWNNVISK